jgi:mRNA-degrading endonuclease toxin of MazEF toxin-antitoxin module
MHRGEIWECAPAKAGRNESGETRLVLLLSNDALAILPLRVVVPLVPWKEQYNSAPWMVRIPPVLNSGLEQVMAADALQVRSLSASRLKRKLGSLPDRLVCEAAEAVTLILKDARQAQV